MIKQAKAIVGILAVFGLTAWYIYLAKIKWHGLILNKEVKPIEVFTLAFTVIIAILLQYYVVFAASNQRAEKDLLILNANDALAKLRDCRDTFLKCFEDKRITRSDQTRIHTQIRSLNHAFDALEISLGKSSCCHLKNVCAQLTQKALSYKGILTGGNFPTGPYLTNVYTQHQTAYRDIDVTLQGLIFSINKA